MANQAKRCVRALYFVFFSLFGKRYSRPFLGVKATEFKLDSKIKPPRIPKTLNHALMPALYSPYETTVTSRHQIDQLGARVAQAEVNERPRDIFKRADDALYKAKQSGRDRVLVYVPRVAA